MDERQILNEVTQLFHQVFDDDSIVLTPETTADDVDGWDSFHHVILTVALETHFKIKFQSAELEELRNVGDLVAMVARKLAPA